MCQAYRDIPQETCSCNSCKRWLYTHTHTFPRCLEMDEIIPWRQFPACQSEQWAATHYQLWCGNAPRVNTGAPPVQPVHSWSAFVRTGSEVQMYADDIVIYVNAKSKQQAAQELTTLMVQVTKWLSDSSLHLNVKKKHLHVLHKEVNWCYWARCLCVRGEDPGGIRF